MTVTVEWLVGVAMVMIGVGMGMFYALSGRLDRVQEQLRAAERDLAESRRFAAETYVRADGMALLRTELKSAIHDLRNEWMSDTQRREARAERTEADILAQLAMIKDSMSRMVGDKRTRAGEA